MKPEFLLLVAGVAFSSVILVVAGCGGVPAVPSPPLPVVNPDREVDDALYSGINPEWMDTTVSPSEDFYRYACGSWTDEALIPDGYSSFSGFDENNDSLQADLLSLLADSIEFSYSDAELARNLYRSGLNREAVEEVDTAPLSELLSLIDGVQDRETFSFALGRLQQAGVTPFFKIHRPLSWELLDRNYLYLRQTSLGFADAPYSWELASDSAAAEMLFISQLLAEIGYEESLAFNLGDRIVELEQKLSENAMDSYDMRDFHLNYNPMSLGDLSDQYDEVNWDEFMNGLGIRSPAKVVVGQTEYFSSVNTVLADGDWQLIRAYMQWALLCEFAPALSSRFSVPASEFNEFVYGSTGYSPEETMLFSVKKELPDILGEMYLEVYFTDSHRNRATAMFANLRSAYDARLRRCEWLEESTRAHALVKLSTAEFVIGGPDAPDYYNGAQVHLDTYLENILSLRQIRMAEHLSRLDEPLTGGVWIVDSYTANCWSLPSKNAVLFPAAAVNELLRDDCDDAYAYGAFGCIVAHEITHLFDRTGRGIDEQGRFRNWWAGNDLEQYEILTDGLILYYEDLGSLRGMELNGHRMFDENFADVIGIRVAYDAFQLSLGDNAGIEKNGFSPTQRFFLANAQKWRAVYTSEGLNNFLQGWHAPGMIRAVGPTSLCQGFREAFPDSSEPDLLTGDENLRLIW